MFSTITPINRFLTEFIQISKSYSEIIWYSKAEWNVRKPFFFKKIQSVMAVHTYNPSNWKIEAERARVSGHPWLHNKTEG